MPAPTRTQLRLLAKDTQGSTVFYAGTFGMRVTERVEDGRAVALQAIDPKYARLSLLLVSQARAGDDVSRSFTLVVESVEDMRTLCVMADLTGGNADEPRRTLDGRWETTLTDPSGNIIKLTQPLPGGRAQGKWAASTRTAGRDAGERDTPSRDSAESRQRSRAGEHARTA